MGKTKQKQSVKIRRVNVLPSKCMAIILAVILLCIAIIIAIWQLKTEELPMPTLSSDKKSIMSGDKILLAIDDDAIFEAFKDAGNPCYGDGTQQFPDYCQSKTTFKEQTRFEAIMPSPDKKSIGFSVETDLVTSDTMLGMLQPYKNGSKVHILTSLYMGNKFISFSPNGTSFVYVDRCWEAMCGLTIKNTDTFDYEKKINNSDPVDTREYNTIFIRWLDDNNVEYMLDSINSANYLVEQANF